MEKKSGAANGNGMAPNRYDRTRNGKAKIPRRTESGRKEDNMAKFKVGDRVKIVRNDYLNCEIGDTGTIMAYNSGAGYAVELDIPRPSYHGCRGLTTPGHGQWALEENIELIEPIKDKPTREFKLIITSSGDTTTAKLIHGERTVVKEATVTRYSKDEYSEKAAVEAVVKKIFEKKVDWFNGKVVCVAYSGDGFTKGKIYECIEGELTSDSGDKMGAYTIEKMKNSQIFLPIVE